MDTYMGIFAASFAVALSGALMPGPLLAATIAESIGTGLRAGPLISVGHVLLEAGLLALLAAGFSRFLGSPGVLMSVTAAGSAFLLYTGMKMLSSVKDTGIAQARARKSTPLRLIAAGIVVSATNPYWIIWWMTVGLGLALSSMKTGAAGTAFFFAGHAFADVLWLTAVSFLIARRQSLMSDRAYKAVLFCCSLSLIGFAFYFLLKLPLVPR